MNFAVITFKSRMIPAVINNHILVILLGVREREGAEWGKGGKNHFLEHAHNKVKMTRLSIRVGRISSTREAGCFLNTLHHGVRGLHGGQVGDDGDVVVSAGALDVDVDGALDLAVEAGHHARGVRDVGQAALAVVPGEAGRFAVSEIGRRERGKLAIIASVVTKADTGGQQHTMRGEQLQHNVSQNETFIFVYFREVRKALRAHTHW